MSLSLRRALLALALLYQPLPVHAAPEDELRVAMIYNIARFVQWPRSALTEKSFKLCAVGNNAVTDGLPLLRGKQLNELPIALQMVKRDNDLAGCNLIYVAPEEMLRLAFITENLAAQRAAPLTISDAPSFLALGGMVQLVTVTGRQRFRINQAIAEKNGLSINAKLLQLALPGDDD